MSAPADVITSNKPVTALLLFIVGGGALFVALLLWLGIRAIVLYGDGSFAPRQPTDWIVLVVVFGFFPVLLFFFFKIAWAESINLIQNFDSRVEIDAHRLVHVNNRRRTEILVRNIVEIRSLRGRFGRFFHEIESADGSVMKLDAWRYQGINAVIANMADRPGGGHV